MRAYAAQTRTELVLSLRHGEQLLVSIVIPLLLLVFFSLVDVLPTARRASTDSVDFLAPGVLALAVMSSAMVSLGIGTGFERQYGVLKRLGATPLGRPPAGSAPRSPWSSPSSVIQVIVLVAAAFALGWDPGRHPGAGAGRRAARHRRLRRARPAHGRHAAGHAHPGRWPTASTWCCCCSAA